MTLDEYNAAMDEVESLRAYASSFTEEAEARRRAAVAKARDFIKEKLGEDALVSISTALYQIERMEEEGGE